MKYIKLDLLTLLISLFIFSSCEKEGTIGLDIAPQDSINSVFTDTATVHATTVLEDSVLTSGLTQNPFGYMNDPIFGTTEANLALGIALPSDNYSFPTNATLDSAVLVLKYGDEFYGDSLTSDYTINVHQLSTKYNFNNYYSNENWGSYNGAPLINTPLTISQFAWNDSISIRRIIKGQPDTLTKVAPQIRIPLNSVFINSYFLRADPAMLKNNTTFSNFIRGVYVTIDKSPAPQKGGIVFFDLQSSVSAIEIYYKSSTDTNLVTFKVSGSSEIKHNYTGTPVETQLQSTAEKSIVTYVQPLAGVRTKLRFPYLKKFKEQYGNISINKAELVIPVINGSDSPLKPAPRLTLYQSDIAGQRRPVPDNAIGLDNRYQSEVIFGGFYNATNKTYSFNITSYIQDLITKPTPQYDTFIAPIDLPLTQNSNIFPAANTAARSVLGGTDHPQSPIKLKITYTKPN